MRCERRKVQPISGECLRKGLAGRRDGFKVQFRQLAFRRRNERLAASDRPSRP
jgi:hypothetical protein